MSLFGREPRSVYRVYAEDEYDGKTKFFIADAELESRGSESQADPAFFDHRSTGVGSDSRQPALATRGFEPRLHPIALLVVGLIFAVAAIAAVLVASSTSQRAPRRSAAASTPAMTSVSPGSPAAKSTPTRPRSPAAQSTPTPTRPRSVHRSNQPGRPSTATSASWSGGALVSAVVPVPAALARPLQDIPAPSIAGEFGFER
jgi:hypothetical protein